MPKTPPRRFHPAPRLAAFVTAVAALAVLLPAVAWAQDPAPPAGRARWSFEFYGGGITQSQSSSGTPIGEFPIGDAFTTATQTGHPSRFHASWRFGDGALLFNQAAARFSQIEGRPFATIMPIDDVVRASGSRSGNRAAFGIRLGRELSPTVALEIFVERNSGGLTASDATIAALTAANDSFKAAFQDLLGTAPVTLLQVESIITVPDSSGTQTRIMGALTKVLTRGARWSLTGTAGGGVQLNGGEAAEIRLNGRYQFSLFGTSPIFERDEVFIQYDEPDSAVIGLLGVGALYDLTATSSVRLGIRAHLAANGATTTMRTAPHVNTGQSPGTLPSVTTPSLQFSNTTTSPSSLRPSMASTLTTFTGSGLNRQIVVTFGLVRRF